MRDDEQFLKGQADKAAAEHGDYDYRAAAARRQHEEEKLRNDRAAYAKQIEDAAERERQDKKARDEAALRQAERQKKADDGAKKGKRSKGKQTKTESGTEESEKLNWFVALATAIAVFLLMQNRLGSNVYVAGAGAAFAGAIAGRYYKQIIGLAVVLGIAWVLFSGKGKTPTSVEPVATQHAPAPVASAPAPAPAGPTGPQVQRFLEPDIVEHSDVNAQFFKAAGTIAVQGCTQVTYFSEYHSYSCTSDRKNNGILTVFDAVTGARLFRKGHDGSGTDHFAFSQNGGSLIEFSTGFLGPRIYRYDGRSGQGRGSLLLSDDEEFPAILAVGNQGRLAWQPFGAGDFMPLVTIGDFRNERFRLNVNITGFGRADLWFVDDDTLLISGNGLIAIVDIPGQRQEQFKLCDGGLTGNLEYSTGVFHYICDHANKSRRIAVRSPKVTQDAFNEEMVGSGRNLRCVSNDAAIDFDAASSEFVDRTSRKRVKLPDVGTTDCIGIDSARRIAYFRYGPDPAINLHFKDWSLPLGVVAVKIEN